MIKKSVRVALPNGLEARPVAELVQVASKYDSNIYIEVDSKRVNAKSIMGMMTLELDSGEAIMVSADGEDEVSALQEVESFLKGDKVLD
ncbi:MAG: HPr family phosphocarrier protein [Eubacteriales bacterium]|nr:HPr family phosphocarrier protein [Eubacteriales bacterium]